MNLRVLHLINSLDRAGAEIAVAKLSLELVKSGAKVSIAALAGGDPHLVDEGRANGVDVELLGERNIRNPICLWKLHRLLRRGKWDVLHAHLFPTQYWAALTAAKEMILVTTEHTTLNRRMKYRVLQPLEAAIYRRYSCVICNSDATADRFATWLPSVKELIRVIENGIDVEQISNYPRADFSKLGIQGPVVLCVGRLEYEKGQDVLVRAIQHIPGATLVLVGTGSRYGKLVELARSLHLGERVRFLGQSTEVAGLMKGCDVYVQPSRWEGFGMAALEAIASGARIVASDVPGLGDLVRQVGRVSPPNDYVLLANAITDAMKDPVDQESRTDLLARYSLRKACRKHLELYVSIVSSARASGPAPR